MANIFIDNLTVKNLYFGGINDLAAETEESSCDERTSEIKTVNIDPDMMAIAISVVEHIDLETVKKVLTGAGQFLKSAAEIEGTGNGR